MILISNFTCQCCHHSIPLPRKQNKQRPNEHIKDLYCPWCGRVQKMLECKPNEEKVAMSGKIYKGEY